MDFCSLHTHTTFSFADGYGMPEDHAHRIAELDMTAAALTEHGNMISSVKWQQAAFKNGIKPIYGVEAYTAPVDMRETKNQRKWHQTILASDLAGYRNLMAAVTRSASEDFYRWPTITWPNLAEHASGLIVLSGCADSKIACDLLGGKGIEHGDARRALRTAFAYREMFGDRFFLEVQRFPGLERTRKINSTYSDWAARYGFQLAATADVHYPYPSDNEMQKILHAAGRNTGTVSAAEAEWEYDILLTYPLSDNEIWNDLVKTGLTWEQAGAAIDNTAVIAERCNVELPVMEQIRFPYTEENAHSEDELIRRWLSEGWAYRGLGLRPASVQRAYKARAEHELQVLRDKGFLSYILMLADLVQWAKRQGIAVGPGRGSGAGSLVLWLLRVTEVNSMDFPLMLFDRFVAPDRDDLPDVDIDFESTRREEVQTYAIEKYGSAMVGNVGTLTYYRGKNSVDTVGRTHQIPFTVTNLVKNYLDDKTTLQAARATFPSVEKAFEDWPALEFAMRLEGNIAGRGVHAAGIAIGADELHLYTPSYTHTIGTGKKARTVQVLSIDKYDGEPLGLMKLDALGLKTMDIIKTAADRIGMSMDEVYEIDLSDPEVMAGFRAGDVGGVFQFEGSTTRDICVEIAPREFMDLSHITALARPGPLHGGSTADFIKARQTGHRDRIWPDVVEKILASTEGEIVYQEQVILLAREVGGFDAVGASKVRSIISKKKGQAAFAELFDQFLAGALERGLSEEQTREIWHKMITAGGYSFNVAHAVSYSVLSVWCMWFRVHHPVAFFYARLVHNVGAIDSKTKVPKTQTILKDMIASTDIKLLSLDTTRSRYSWSVEDGGLRPGFAQIPGIGEVIGLAIAEWRDTVLDPSSLTWADYQDAHGVGPKKIQDMIAFAENPDPFEIGKIGRNTKGIVAAIRRGQLVTEEGEMLPEPTKVSTDIPYAAGQWDGVMLGVIQEVQHKDLFEGHLNRTGKPLDPKEVRDPHLSKSVSIYCEDVRGRFKLNVSRFTYPRYAAEIEAAVTGRDYVLVEVSKANFPGKTIFANQLSIIEPDE